MRALFTAGALLAMVVVAGVTVWWFFIASFGDRQVQSLIANAAREGVTISVGERERSGFPLRIRWHLRDVDAVFDGPEGKFQAAIPGIQVAVDAWRPRHMTYAIDDEQTWRWTPAGGGERRTYTIRSAAGALGPRTDEPGWRITAALRDVGWTAGGGRGGTATVDGELLTPFDRGSADFSLRTDDLTLSAPQAFGRTVESALLAGSITPVPQAVTPAALTAWQRAGGRLTIAEAQIAYGELQASVEGGLALDDVMRPDGRLTLTVVEPQPVLALASDRGWVTADQLGYAQIGMGMFTRRDEQGRAALNTTLDLRDGGLWIGPFRLADLPPLIPLR